MHSYHLNSSTLATLVMVLLVGMLTTGLVVYYRRRRRSTGNYTVEGKDSFIPRQQVVVRVEIIPVPSNEPCTVGCTQVDNQDAAPKYKDNGEDNQAQDCDVKQDAPQIHDCRTQAPLWSKLDLGSRHPPVFVDLNTLEYI